MDKLEEKKTIEVPAEEWESIVKRLSSLEQGKKRLMTEPDEREATIATYKNRPVVSWDNVEGEGRKLTLTIYTLEEGGKKEKHLVDYLSFLNDRNNWVKVLITNISKKSDKKVVGQGYKIDPTTDRVTNEIVDYTVESFQVTASVRIITEGPLMGLEFDTDVKYLNP